jgi:hypothetical protein
MRIFFPSNYSTCQPRSEIFVSKWGWVGKSCTDAWYSHHVVHHFLTFRKSHVTQFSNEEERARLDSHLKERRFDYIIECRYGLILGCRLRDYAMYMAPTVPIFISLCCIGGSWFTIGACSPLCLWPMLAQFIHRYLHMRYRDVIDCGPFVVRVLAKTAYFRYLARHHRIRGGSAILNRGLSGVFA